MYHLCTTLVTTSKTTYELCFMPDRNGLSDLISKTVRQTALMLSFRTFLVTILQIFQNVVFDIYRFRNSKPKNQSGVFVLLEFLWAQHWGTWQCLEQPTSSGNGSCCWFQWLPVDWSTSLCGGETFSFVALWLVSWKLFSTQEKDIISYWRVIH